MTEQIESGLERPVNLSLYQERYCPINDRILVRRIKGALEPGTTPGGILIPEAVRERKRLYGVAKVLAVGPGKPHPYHVGDWEPMPVQVGDVVYFDEFKGVEIKLAGETLIVLQVDDLLLSMPADALGPEANAAT